MDTTYICDQMNIILGEKFSKIDYKVKYEIVYGFMPRPDYIAELNEIFAVLRSTRNEFGGLKIKKSKCPKFLQQKDKVFVINGWKIGYSRTAIDAHLSGRQSYAKDFTDTWSSFRGNGEDTEDAVIFYKFVYLDISEVSRSDNNLPRYKYSRSRAGIYTYPENVYLLLDCCFKLVKWAGGTCKFCKQLYQYKGRKPSKPITKKNVKEMAWELIKDDPREWLENPMYGEAVGIYTTYSYRSEGDFLLCPDSYPPPPQISRRGWLN